MDLAWEASPTGLFLGSQPGNDDFFEKIGYERSLRAYVRRKPRPVGESGKGTSPPTA